MIKALAILKNYIEKIENLDRFMYILYHTKCC